MAKGVEEWGEELRKWLSEATDFYKANQEPNPDKGLYLHPQIHRLAKLIARSPFLPTQMAYGFVHQFKNVNLQQLTE